MKRLIKSNRSIQMNNDVQDFIIKNDNRFDNEYMNMAKKIIQKMRIMPTYERYFNLAQDIKSGKYNNLPDFENNIELWVKRTEEILKNNKILLANRLYSFDEIKKIQTSYDVCFFDNDPKYQNSKFKLITINLSNIELELSQNDRENINLYLEEGYADDTFIEEVGEIIKLLNDNIELEPIVINKDNFIIDGFHRCFAYLYLNYKTIDVYKEV